MKRLLGAFVLTLTAAAGCSCPDAYFAEDQPFEVTVVQQRASSLPCDASRPRTLADGETFTLLGTGDQSFEAGMCDDGSLKPSETPAFATELLTSCLQATASCSGQLATGCTVMAYGRAWRDRTMTSGDGAATGTFSINWQSGCSSAFNCEERYDVTFRPAGR